VGPRIGLVAVTATLYVRVQDVQGVPFNVDPPRLYAAAVASDVPEK
jgi:hypothetical protein